MQVFVYGLSDQATPEHVRYVGVSRHPELRLYQHLEEALWSASTYKLNWIRKVVGEGREIRSSILAATASDSEAFLLEIRFIAALRAAGHKLTNLTAGGEGFRPRRRRRRLRRQRSWKPVGRILRAVHSCSICASTGHNRITCPKGS